MVAVSNHLKLALAWVTALNNLDLDQLSQLAAPDFVSIVRPATLGIGPRNFTAFSDTLKTVPIKTFGYQQPADSDIIETSDVVFFYTHANGSTTHGFPWKNEYYFTFTFSNDGKIASTTEFADPGAAEAALQNEAIVAQATNTC
ncbi:hypothetical protein LshimejAT787_0603930 [Lyophyllum shimeji]|uniref:SnoaL-like domain-containing protein n=1 Tax=Lyophyllum shimeji TaxID=47721 RepID=A0A9P3PP65_LYOSH|nr:hypothetical protein LshimejAT787_0603930 [Lyophyllum shimeji]